jgi:hypothetical protein
MKNSIMMILLLAVMILPSACEFGQKNLWEESTGDSSDINDELALLDSDPESNQSIVGTDTALLLFNKPIILDAGSIYVTMDGTIYPCSISLDPSDHSAVIIQKTPQFDENANYAINITTSVKDTLGKYLVTPLTIPFKVNNTPPPPPTGNPSIATINPDPASPIAKNASITIKFDRLMKTSCGSLLIQQTLPDGVVTSFTYNHRWLKISGGNGNFYKFRPVNPNKYIPGLPLTVILSNFESAGGSALPAGTTITFSIATTE